MKSLTNHILQDEQCLEGRKVLEEAGVKHIENLAIIESLENTQTKAERCQVRWMSPLSAGMSRWCYRRHKASSKEINNIIKHKDTWTNKR